MEVLSEYQRRTIELSKAGSYCGSLGRRLVINRMWELVEDGLTMSEALRLIGSSWSHIHDEWEEGEMARMKRLAIEMRSDRISAQVTFNREAEALVCSRIQAAGDGEVAVKRPYKAGRHLVGKRHNITAPLNKRRKTWQG